MDVHKTLFSLLLPFGLWWRKSFRSFHICIWHLPTSSAKSDLELVGEKCCYVGWEYGAVAVHLPSTCKALGSVPFTAQNKSKMSQRNSTGDGNEGKWCHKYCTWNTWAVHQTQETGSSTLGLHTETDRLGIIIPSVTVNSQSVLKAFHFVKTKGGARA